MWRELLRGTAVNSYTVHEQNGRTEYQIRAKNYCPSEYDNNQQRCPDEQLTNNYYDIPNLNKNSCWSDSLSITFVKQPEAVTEFKSTKYPRTCEI